MRFILLGWFVRWEASSRTAVVLYDVVKKICSKWHAVFLRSSIEHFLQDFIKVQMVPPNSSSDTATAKKNSRFILCER